MTEREYFTTIRTVVADYEELVAFVDKKIAQLDKKSSTPSKAVVEKREQNAKYKADILAYMTIEDKPLTFKEIMSGVPELSELSAQKVTHLLTALYNEGAISRDYVKKVPYYGVVAPEDDTADDEVEESEE